MLESSNSGVLRRRYSAFVMLAFCTWCTAATYAQEVGWKDELLLGRPITELMIDEVPDTAQLELARNRTKAVIDGCKFAKEPQTEDEQQFRRGLRAHFLQLNLEYQTFLAASGEVRLESARRALIEYRSVLKYLWFEPGADSNGQQFITLRNAEEDELQWQDAKPFLDMIYHDIKEILPPEPTTISEFVRNSYFSGISPSQDGGINHEIRDMVGNTFEELQNLGKEAIAAKVQAAVVMRRFYGVTPEATKATFLSTDQTKEVKLEVERKSLFPEEGVDWDLVKSLIRDVASGGVGGGVVSDYLALNLSLDENGGRIDEHGRRTRHLTGYDGLLAEIKKPRPSPEATEKKQECDTEAAFSPSTDFILPEYKCNHLRSVLARSYGRFETSGSIQKSMETDQNPEQHLAKTPPYATLWELMSEANAQSDSLLGRVRDWQTAVPKRENLDSLFIYELTESSPKSNRKPAAGDEFYVSAPPANVQRTWFTNLPTPNGGNLDFSLAGSSDRTTASAIPEIKLDRTYSSQVDVLIRRLAASSLLAGTSLEANSATKRSEGTQYPEKAAGLPPTVATVSPGSGQNPANNKSVPGTRPPADTPGNQSPLLLSELEANLHKRLLSRQAINLAESKNGERRTVLDLLENLWNLYLPDEAGRGGETIRLACVKWLKSRLDNQDTKGLNRRLNAPDEQLTKPEPTSTEKGDKP